MLLPEKLLVQENEMQPQKKVLEEKPQDDLLEGEDARTSSFFSYIWYELLPSLFIFEIAIWNTEANMWRFDWYLNKNVVLVVNL